MDNLNWYGAKTIYKHNLIEDDTAKTLFEERVVLFQAVDFDGAIAQAEVEAEAYAVSHDVEYLGFMDVFHIFDEKVGQGTEIYSLMRESGLSGPDYLDRFYDDGSECWQKSKDSV
jgi:Domain of unknown function (DUF4288)